MVVAYAEQALPLAIGETSFQKRKITYGLLSFRLFRGLCKFL